MEARTSATSGYERASNTIVSSQLVLLTKNFGSFAAVRAGLEYGRGDFFAVMAADLQEPPELIVGMAKRLARGGG